MWRPVLPLLLIMLLSSGCSRNTPPGKDMQTSSRNLMLIFSAYKGATDRLGRYPVSRDEIMPDLNAGSSPEKVFKSPEDGEDYVIHWGADPESAEAVVLAYEKTGKNGIRYVLRNHVVFQMKDEDFKKAPFPPGTKPPF